MLSLREKVWWFALSSRIFILIISAIFNLILPDHSADAFRIPKDSEESLGDIVVEIVFGGLVRWDAQYFLHIALYGYTYENCLAFFPLLPLVIRFTAAPASYILQDFLSQYSIYVVSAVLVNVCCFVKAAIILYDLSLTVIRDVKLAYIAALLFCINPASIFFTAPYSETLFAFLSFYGMLMCSKSIILNCGIPFGLAASARSNGILGIGFILYYQVKHIVNQLIPRLLKEVCELDVRRILMVPMMIVAVIIHFFPCMMAIFLALVPFIGFQTYSYYKFCIPHSHNLPEFLTIYAEANKFILPGTNYSETVQTHWCNGWLPLSYSYVQSYYWDVGFLKYYQWKQIPNFLLASPIICIIVMYAYTFLECNLHACLTLGLLSPDPNSASRKPNRDHNQNGIHPLYSPETFVYVLHAVVLTLFSVLFINIQVTTRLLSSASPVLYWFAASTFSSPHYVKNWNFLHHFINKTRKDRDKKYVEALENMDSKWRTLIITHIPMHTKGKLLQGYFLLYFIIGTAMFSNFYPWT